MGLLTHYSPYTMLNKQRLFINNGKQEKGEKRRISYS